MGIPKDSDPSAQFLLDIGERHTIAVMRREHKLSKELRESKKISIPVLNVFLTLERHIIVVMRVEHKLSKELGESKWILIPVLNLILTLDRDIL